jgi:hypothetical protein
MRLDPRDPMKAFFLQNVAVGLYFSREYDAAIEAANRTIRSYPAFPNIYRWLAAALVSLAAPVKRKERCRKRSR